MTEVIKVKRPIPISKKNANSSEKGNKTTTNRKRNIPKNIFDVLLNITYFKDKGDL